MSKQSFAFAFVLALATIGTVVSPARSGPDENGWEKMVFHVDDSRYARWMLMLARSYLEDSPKASLVIVAYGPGVDFALEGAEDSNGNPYAPSLFELTSKGVAIRLCGTTLRAREIAPGSVVDGVEVVPSGIAEIARLQLKMGYAYLKP